MGHRRLIDGGSSCASFAQWCEKLGAFARKASTSQIVKDIQKAFGLVDSALGAVVRFFGGGLLEALRGQLVFLDNMAGWIRTAVERVTTILRPAADWVLAQLGLPSIAEIDRWLRDLAAKAWQKIKDAVASGVTLIKDLGPKLLQFTLLGPIDEATASIDELRDAMIAAGTHFFVHLRPWAGGAQVTCDLYLAKLAALRPTDGRAPAE